MTTNYSTMAAIGIITLTLGGSAAAQDRSALMTSIEVDRLVAAGRPEDHARLRDHFSTLADIYASEVERYQTVGPTFGNPNHPVAVPPGGYDAARIEKVGATVVSLRALAAYHGERAAGRAALLPPGTDAFERGEGAPQPTAGQIRELVESARTAADHRALEAYFTREADRETTRAQWHNAMAQMNRAQANDRGNVRTGLALHCEHEASVAQAAARALRAAADKERQAVTRG